MKKAITVVLLAVCIIMLAVCTKAQKNTFQVKNGMYVNKTNEMGAYVFFDTEHLNWRSGAGLIMSYAVGGEYQINGNQIIAKSNDGQIEIVFEMKSETELKAHSVKCATEGMDFWITKDDEFQFHQFEGTASLLHIYYLLEYEQLSI